MRAAFFLLAALWLLPDAAFAAERARVVFPPLRPLTADCVLDAAHISGMPVAALFAILATEGGKTGEALSNRNGTWDIGPFQVNTIHLNDLAAMGISPDAVLRDGRVNAYAAEGISAHGQSLAGHRRVSLPDAASPGCLYPASTSQSGTLGKGGHFHALCS